MTGWIRKPWTGARVVFDGQSLNLRGAMIFSQDPYPYRLMLGRGLPWANVAVSGASWTDLANGTGTADGQPATSRLHPQADNSAAKTILCMFGGQNDLGDGDDGATVHADHVSYADAARAAGFTHVIVGTIPGSSNYDASEETARNNCNALLVADSAGDFDGVVDLTGTSLDTHNDTDFWDSVHFTTTGAQKCADNWAPVLDAVLAL